MNKKKFTAVVPATIVMPLILPADAGAHTKGEKLNIIHIMADDHAFQAISAYGHPLSKYAPTPNIDRIAREGIIFDRAYVENSVSTPSRACLMTGLYSHQSGQTMLGNVLDTTVTFVPELLQKAGYQTAMIGKWHMKCEPKGFDTYHVLLGQGLYYRPKFKTENTNGKYIPEKGYITDAITKHAIEFLENRDPDKPFCLYVHHKAPHRRWEPDLKYLELYEDVDFPMPENLWEDYSERGAAFKEQRMSIDVNMFMLSDLKVFGWEGPEAPSYDALMGREVVPPKKINLADTVASSRAVACVGMNRDQALQWYKSYVKRNRSLIDNWKEMSHRELVEWKYQRYVKDYLRVIKSVDDSVGELLDYLEAHGLMENTVIVYCSDQGFYMGEHGWFDKRFMYEESYRTPLIVRYPGNAGGTNCDALVQNIDFGPTYLDIAGAEQPDEMSGRSLLPILKRDGKEPVSWRKYLYYHFYDHTPEHNALRHDGISDKRYKLIHFYDETGELPCYDEFYDLYSDPSEMDNVINDPKYRHLVRKFQRKLVKVRKKLGVEEF